MPEDAKQTIEDGKVVFFRYDLSNDDGEELDSSGDDAVAYLHGADNIVPGLEREMAGKTEGERFHATIKPEDAYGEKTSAGAQAVPREAFPDDAELEIGMPVFAETDDGEVIELWITDADGESVYVDSDHPLAGETLHFAIEIVSIRDATDEERDHGHVHGPGGAHD